MSVTFINISFEISDLNGSQPGPGPGRPPVVQHKFLVVHREFYKFLIKLPENYKRTILNYVISTCLGAGYDCPPKFPELGQNHNFLDSDKEIFRTNQDFLGSDKKIWAKSGILGQ